MMPGLPGCSSLTLDAARLGSIALAGALGLLATALALPTVAQAQAQAQAPVLPGMSPVVTWDPESVYGGVAREPTQRALTAGETQRAKRRAEMVFDALKLAPSFSQPAGLATYLNSWAVVNEQRLVEQKFVAYASNPRDVRRRSDGALWGVMGGSHDLMFMWSNRLPNALGLTEREHQAFARQVSNDGRPQGMFVAPRVHAEVGGGQLYGGYLLITRDGRPTLESAPIGALLELDIASHRKTIAEVEKIWAASLRELDASMTPEAIVERRAKREARWQKETRDTQALAQRLDAAHRSDEADTQRQRERMSVPQSRDPRSVYWGPRLALEALEKQLAALDAAGREQGACGWRDSGFGAGQDVRWALAGAAAPPNCLPMVRVRQALLADPGPADEVRLFIALLGEESCGQRWKAATGAARSSRCEHHLPLLRDLDWAALRRALAW